MTRRKSRKKPIIGEAGRSNILTVDCSASALARLCEVNMAKRKDSFDQVFDNKGGQEKQSETLQRAIRVNGRYVDPWGTAHMPSLFEVLTWKLTEKNERGIRGSWRELFRFNTEELEKNLPVLTLDSAVLSSPPSDNIQVTWLGHASVLVQMDGFNILADPILNSYCGPTQMFSMTRYRPAPCTVNELPRIDAVCISHDHYDHLDLKTVKELHQRFGDQLQWFVPMGLKSWMASSGCKNAVELEWWEESELSKKTDTDIQSHRTVKFVFTPTQHWCRRSATDKNQVLWGSWTIIGPRHRFFFAGDTGYCKGFKQIGKHFGPFDFAAIPIGAYKPRWFAQFAHVDPKEAVCIHEDVQSRCSLGIHWGTFPTGKEHYMDPPKDLSEALKAKEIPGDSFFIMKHGETRVIK